MMTWQDARDIHKALVDLRSGDPVRMDVGELALLRLARHSPTACACPHYPSERSRDCFAHPYILRSALEASTAGTVTLRGAVASIRAKLGEERP